MFQAIRQGVGVSSRPSGEKYVWVAKGAIRDRFPRGPKHGRNLCAKKRPGARRVENAREGKSS